MHAVAKCHHGPGGAEPHHKCHSGPGIAQSGCTHTQQTIAAEVTRGVLPTLSIDWPDSPVAVFLPVLGVPLHERGADPPELPPPISPIV